MTEIFGTKFPHLICCPKNMIDGLINIDEIRYETLCFSFSKRIHSYKINIPISPFLPHNVLFLSQ